jgi:hypothetical protein
MFKRFGAMGEAIEAIASFSIIATFLVMIPQMLLI